jgi:hypothetical protein
MSIRIDNTTGAIILSQFGALRTCACCPDDTVPDSYTKVFKCCDYCEYAWIPTSVADTFGVGTYKVGGQCFFGPGEEVSRAEAEATGKPIYDSGITHTTESCVLGVSPVSPQPEGCPSCGNCCINAYVSKGCFQGAPANSRPSVCCNWGKQYVLQVTQASVFYETEIGEQPLTFSSPGTCQGCTIATRAPVVYNDCTYQRLTTCRVRRNCPGSLQQLTNTRVRTGCQPSSGVGGPCSNGNNPVIPAEAACPMPGPPCDRSSYYADDSFLCPFGDPESPSQQNECPAVVINESEYCSRNCFGGSSESRVENRSYWNQFCCSPGLLDQSCDNCSREACRRYQCTMRYYVISINVTEWSVIVEDETDCNANATCIQYNDNQCVENPLFPPPDECSEAMGCLELV